MTGRDPDEDGRVGSNLEVFYDLVFVVAFAVAGTQLAHYLAEGHYRAAIFGFVLTSFAAIWAWINFAWFASAFDTDDWFYRLLTLVQMIGVAIVAIGIPAVFSSIDDDHHVDLAVVVIGYIVMRVGMITQWLRAAAQSAEYRATCLTYAGATAVAQIGWVVVAVVPTNLTVTLVAIAGCAAIELAGPAVAELTVKGTPWHPHHIAERYATLMVITLGEGVVGTVAVLQALIERTGWSVQTSVLGLAAMGVTFAMWWLYFSLPNGEVLERKPGKCFGFGYGSTPLFMACAAVGAGLHVVALWIEGEAHVSNFAVVMCLAVPVGVYSLGLIGMHAYLAGYHWAEWLMTAGAAVPLASGLVLAAAGAPLLLCVVVVCLTPVIPVLVVEVITGPVDTDESASTV